MAWGRKKQDKERTSSNFSSSPITASPSRSGTVLGSKITITGEVHGEEEMIVLGTIKGKVHTEAPIRVGETGVIEGDVICTSITIEGFVKGNVTAANSITIEATGRLTGDIETQEFINRPGGFFEGYSHMIHEQKPKEDKKQKKASKNEETHDKVGTA